jgi:GNAT superfamily N-acetyltransferase
MLFRKLLGKFVRVETLVVYRYYLYQLPTVCAPDSRAQFTRLDDSDTFRRLCRKYPDKKFNERLRANQQCYVALRGNNIAGYAWATRAGLYVDEIACMYPVSEDEIFIYDCFVDPDYRGAGIYPAMLEFIIRDNRQRYDKLTHASIAASALNRASIRGILKAGFVEQRRIRYIECLQKQKWWGFGPVEI